MIIFKYLLILFTLFVPVANASSEKAQNPEQRQKIELVPNPMSLSVNWWSFFQSDSLPSNIKAKEFLQELENLQKKLSSEEIEAADPYFTKILTQLEIYNTLKPEELTSPTAYPFHQKYTIDQIKSLSEELIKTKASLDQGKTERFRLNNQKTKLELHLDQQSIEYFKGDENNEKRLLLGLNMIGTRFSISIKDKLIASLNKKLQVLEETKVILKNELDHAFSHLDEKGVNKNSLQQRIDRLERELIIKQNESIRAELKALSQYGTSDQNQIENILLQQAAIDSLLDDAIINAEIDTLKLVQLLPLYNKTLSSETATDLSTQIHQTETQLNSLQKSAKEWEAITSQNYNIKAKKLSNDGQDISSMYEKYFETQRSSFEKIEKLQNKLFFSFLLYDNLETRFQSQQSTLSCCWFSISDFYQNFLEKLNGVINFRLFKVNELPITLGSIIWAFITLFFVLFFSSLLRKSLKRVSKRVKSLSFSNLYVIDRLIFYASLLVAIYFFFYAMGFDTSNILIILGGLSVGIGFGLQNIVNNFVCSLLILFHRTIKIGDILNLSTGEWGEVRDINVQNTLIHTWDGTDLVIPNSELISQKYENWTLRDSYKRIHVGFNVSYGSDKDTVVLAALKAADKISATIKGHKKYADPKVWLVNFEDSSLGFELVVWVNLSLKSSVGSFTAAYKWEIESSLREYGITMPFPQRDIHIKEMPKPAKQKAEEIAKPAPSFVPKST